MDEASLARFWAKVDKDGDCWMWTGAKSTGSYGLFWYDGRLQYAHRLSWEIENGDIPPGKLVLHGCDNPPCVNPDHLFLGTPQDIAMMRKKRNGDWSIPADDPTVLAIREDYAVGDCTPGEVAARHDVTRSQVLGYVSGRTKNFPGAVKAVRVEIVGEALMVARKQRGVTQTVMETDLGLGYGAVSRLEHNRVPLSFRWSACRLAEYLGVGVGTITRQGDRRRSVASAPTQKGERK